MSQREGGPRTTERYGREGAGGPGGVGGGLARSAGSHWFAAGPYYKRLQSALVNVSPSLYARRRISVARRRRRRHYPTTRYYYCYHTRVYSIYSDEYRVRVLRYVLRVRIPCVGGED